MRNANNNSYYTEDNLLQNKPYRLRGQETWVDIQNLSVQIIKEKAGVFVAIYPEIHEGRDKDKPLQTMFVPFSAAPTAEDEEAKLRKSTAEMTDQQKKQRRKYRLSGNNVRKYKTRQGDMV